MSFQKKYGLRKHSLITLLLRAMVIIREEIVVNFQPYPKTNVRCPIGACSFFAEQPYDADLGHLNRATDDALRIIEMHLFKHRVHGDLNLGTGHNLRLLALVMGKHMVHLLCRNDTAQLAQQQVNTGLQNSRVSAVVLIIKKKKKNILTKSEDQLLDRSCLRDAEMDNTRKKGLALIFLFISKRKNPKAYAGQVCGLEMLGRRTGLPTAN